VRRERWVWMPHPAHFIGRQDCKFFLATYVGRWIVSTVGEYLPGDALTWHALGPGYNYETMVFRASRRKKGEGDCCPWVISSGRNVDFSPYADPASAAVGHLEMCKKWAGRLRP
jgi:hypothetical protein